MPSTVLRRFAPAVAIAALIQLPSASQAQTRAFVYSLLPAATTATANQLYVDVAYGHDLFQSLGPESFEQRVGVAVRLRSALSFVGEAGWAPRDDATRSDASLRAELLGRFPMRGRAIVGLGAGWMQDYSRTQMTTGRLMLGYEGPKTLAAANLRLEHPFGERAHHEKRDLVDVIMTLGVSRVATGMVRVGIESVAEDLEGFVESDEAEGGAKLMLGPSLGLAPPNAHWRLVVVAGPVMQLTTSSASPTTSGAPRDLTSTGYLIRTSVTLQW